MTPQEAEAQTDGGSAGVFGEAIKTKEAAILRPLVKA
jgi:hypothetical protein